MRDDQYRKLQALNEKLVDVLLVEADPANWTGDGANLSETTKDVRGDRYWCKKNAAATLSVIMKVTSVTGMFERALAGSAPQPDGAEVDEGETDLDREMKSAEKEAKKLLAEVQRRARARHN